MHMVVSGEGGADTINAADVALNNQVSICRVHTGFVAQSQFGTMPDLDSGGSPTATAAIGDSGSNNRFLAASNTVQTGAAVPPMAATGVLYQFTDDTDILLTITAAAATPQAGSGTYYIEGYMQDP